MRGRWSRGTWNELSAGAAGARGPDGRRGAAGVPVGLACDQSGRGQARDRQCRDSAQMGPPGRGGRRDAASSSTARRRPRWSATARSPAWGRQRPGKIIAQNGIQVSRGASAQVLDNTVSGNQYSGGGAASSAGVLLYGGCGDPLVKDVSVAGNTLTNNDVGAELSNSDPSCANPPSTKTDDVVAGNRISDSAVTNTSGASTTPLCGYQAGVQEFGNHDVITENHISGTGYLNHPTCTTAQPYVTYRIDTTGSLEPARDLQLLTSYLAGQSRRRAARSVVLPGRPAAFTGPGAGRRAGRRSPRCPPTAGSGHPGPRAPSRSPRRASSGPGARSATRRRRATRPG